MSKFTDAMTALGAQLAALNPAANAAHFATVDAHLSKLDSEEGADEATIADTSAGLQALLAAANPPAKTSSGSGASSASGASTAGAGTAAASTAQKS